MLLHIFNFSICYSLFVLIQTIISDPICIYDVEDGLQLDIRTLGFANGKGPKYDRISNTNPSTVTFSWNGCFSYSKFDSGNCKDAAACYCKLNILLYLISKNNFFLVDSTSNMSILIAKQDTVQFQYNQGSSVLTYQSSNGYYLTVFLICLDEDEDIAIGRQQDEITYNLYIQSRCCCPGICHYSTHSISPVVIVIIIVVIFLFGYIVGGIIFLRYNPRNIHIDYQEI
jgi:hypothetical protein